MLIQKVAQLCAEYTELSLADQQLIYDYAQHLPVIADLCNADVFIDCLTKTGDAAVVVAEAKPSRGGTLYQEVTVGKLAFAQHEPGVFATFSSGEPCSDLHALTQENFTVQQNIAPLVNDEGRVVAVVIREKDITAKLAQSRKYESMFRTNLRLQETLDSLGAAGPADIYSYHFLTVQLSEMSHRIKNNLQMLASILSMESRRSQNAQAEEILSKNVGRILTIAAFHDILSTLEPSSELALKPLLARVAECVRSCLPPDGCQVEFDILGSDLVVGADQASALMLVANELITNCVKHAFTGRSQGRVEVRLSQKGPYRSMIISDDGVGFSQEGRRQASLGLNIVEATVREKIKGTFSISSGPDRGPNHGSMVRIDF